ncbi:AraC family transcriptional regulator [Hahella sp. SMD15-11]|uniref:AraC family transcriptional regulator n=1 Tax=Thermohahella caldifontis TaxID=3142973 RepID=A0AB39UTT7_9GAMM
MTAEEPFIYQVAVSSVRTLLDWLGEQGVKAAELARQAGLDAETLLSQTDAWVPFSQYVRLWELAEAATGDPAIGLHVGERVDERRMGVMGHIIFNNRTLRDALTQYARLSALMNEAVVASFAVENARAIIRFSVAEPDLYCRQNMDRVLSMAITRARRFVSPRLIMEQVTFAHPAPGYVSEYERIFQCPVSFDAPVCSIVFDAGYLDYELPQRNPYLHKVLTSQLESLLARLPFRRSLADKVRGLIRKHLPSGRVDAEFIAAELAMSRHTLYRKLKAENVVFQELVDEVRLERAKAYLQRDKYSLSEIAFILGFSELSAFSRAFKRWTGQTPAQFRQHARRRRLRRR